MQSVCEVPISSSMPATPVKQLKLLGGTTVGPRPVTFTDAAKLFLYTLFSFTVASVCYLRPVPDDFDRYIYEALIRSGGHQPIEQIYAIVKHESPRAEASSVMDSPEHLAQLEPLYAIRPVYVELATLLTRIGLAPQKAINAISAGSLFLLALLAFGFTRNYIGSALIVVAPITLITGRLGTPDALSSFIVVAGVLAIVARKFLPGILLLMFSIWVRTDNVLIVLVFLAWLVWRREMSLVYAGVLAAMAAASVGLINALSGNYGWKVLLHYSFLGGKYPAEITSGISLAQYVHVFALNAGTVISQLAPWVLLGCVAWKLKQADQHLLVAVLLAAGLHYFLFPSAEARYLTWACEVSALIFVRGFVTFDSRLPSDPMLATKL